MLKNNFVAVDFETAQSVWKKQIFICQVGIVVVENGEIVERISRLVKPPNNKYEKACVDVHRITPQITKHEPTFDVVWQDIEKYFINTMLIAHNAYDFDEKVLWQNLDYFGISPKGINKFIDTKLLFNAPSRSLDALCYGFGFDCENHHDACFDAECCAKIYLKYLNNEYPDTYLIAEYKEQKSEYNIEEREKLKEERTVSWFREQHAISATELARLNILTDNEFDNILSHTMFEGKRVINTGDLFCISRNELKIAISEAGGKYTGMSKLIDIVILGQNPGREKVKTIIELQENGSGIICITENQFEKFLDLIR